MQKGVVERFAVRHADLLVYHRSSLGIKFDELVSRTDRGVDTVETVSPYLDHAPSGWVNRVSSQPSRHRICIDLEIIRWNDRLFDARIRDRALLPDSGHNGHDDQQKNHKSREKNARI